MSLLENVISVFAPHHCLVCEAEGKLLCEWCRPIAVTPVPSRCYRCQKQTQDFATCESCRRRAKLRNVWVATNYEDVAKELLHRLKFERAGSAASFVAEFMSETLPYLPPDTIIAHVPTATSRRRQRGYDQAELLARCLAKTKGLTTSTLLLRSGHSRQVGATRQKRREQLAGALAVYRPPRVKGARILLIDDIVTTGATIEAAADVLKDAGAAHITAAVFAQRLR